MTMLTQLGVIVSPEDSIDLTLRRMAASSKQVTHAGIAFVLGKEERLLGILTDGDLRRAYAQDIPFSRPVSEIMVQDPITIPSSTPPDQIVPEVYRRVRQSKRHRSEWIRHVLLVNEDGRLVNVLDFLDVLQTQGASLQHVAVFGMGYVGVTLAVSLANRGHQVTGIDVLPSVVDRLNNGKPHVYEPGLPDMLRANLARRQIVFDTNLGGHQHGVYIVAVGTPLDKQGVPDLEALKNVLSAIGPLLRRGDQVMLRSTVPVGTTRDVVIPMLEKLSGFKAGDDFHVAFAPERTIEGRAMHELRTLPQVVGGLTSRCLRRASEFWATLTPAVVRVASLEGAELVKLANNTFRDLSFAFANELALLADRYNVDASDVIRAANEGYPRNPIALPSPGVGGYCLTKDPILYGCTTQGPRAEIVLGRASRAVNHRAMLYPVEVLRRFAERQGLALSDLHVLVVGLAFKGEPETADVRGSVALDIIAELRNRTKSLKAWDAVVRSEDLGATIVDLVPELSPAVLEADAVLILNNHADNAMSESYMQGGRPRLIFDGWRQLDAREIEKVGGVTYATMGYMTPKK